MSQTPRDENPLAGGCLASTPGPLAEAYDTLMIDLDGVVYRGDHAVPAATQNLRQARRHGCRLMFVTNNAARTPAAVAAQLSALGIDAQADEVVTSAQAAAHLLADLVPVGSAVLVVGGDGLVQALGECGLRPVRSADDDPAAVVQGFHPDVGWRQLAEATLAVRRGLPWVVANVDLTLPTPRGEAPGNGALVGVVQRASGRDPDAIAGKPYPPLFREAASRSSAQAPLVVGDRADTDIEGAVRAGYDSLLVLTGVTSPDALSRLPQSRRPTFVGFDLRALAEPHPPVVVSDQVWHCGGWRALVRGDGLSLEGSGGRTAGLRAVTAAVWAHGGRLDLRHALHRLEDGEEHTTP